ncbi:right-handed parallel beta-helix repeat-containing protein [Catenuloplanes atrovinosus]|uniref:Parallel beta-helix repeat protein n=1 Tax=Catenuloplanes atrovinosus TaxID=137266 RepID=A0AAE3YMU0_9ACTN|nr:right-handed parallel beta-helix repeat-containing protein [Catenuloplanes atrovinosus]MDR7275079.1 parallel beta-helix repeat protein [Catenuloplanes atrovinosus]
MTDIFSRRNALRAAVVGGAAATGAAVMAPAAQAAPADEGWVSVLDHGAVGDGVTDDTAKIQAALNAAQAARPQQSVYFPAGRVFRVSDELSLTGYANATIAGNGATLALAGAKPSEKGARRVLRLSDVREVTVQDLTIRDTDRTQQFDGLLLSRAKRCVVRGVRVIDVRWTGISVFDQPPAAPDRPALSDDVLITECVIEGTRQGISVNGRDIRIVGNHVAMDWWDTPEAVRPWEASSDYYDGICVLFGADRTVISGNTITACGQSGIYTQAVKNLVITGNTVTRCVLRGIEIDGQRKHGETPSKPTPEPEKPRAYNVAITGNTLENNLGNINVLYTVGVTVTGNVIRNDREGTCIAINQRTDGAVVVGNECHQEDPGKRPAIWVKPQETLPDGTVTPPATNVTVAWNRIAAVHHTYAPADTVIMQPVTDPSAGKPDMIKATGKVIAMGGIGVGNAAAATRPGTVVRRIEVFDAAGASIGFVPVYNSIT